MPSPYYMPVLRCQGLAASGGAALNRRWLTTQSGPSSVELNTSNFLRRTYGDGLTALSHAAYAEEEVHAQAVVEVELQIDKEAHTVRVLGSCRSFRHPDAGIRVSRDGGHIFEGRFQSGDVYFIRVPYFCSPIDATVSIAMGDFVRLYLVEQTPTYRLVNEWAIPADHPLAARARVRLTSIRVDTESELVTARITDRLKTGSSATPFVSVLAVYAWRIPVALLDEQLRAQLQNTASIKLPSDLSKAISADIVKKRIVPMGVVSQYPRDVVALLKQAPLEQIPARGGNAFELRDEDQGHRFFYPVVSPASPEFQIRVKGIESGRYGLFYDVQAGVILWPDWEIMQHARPQ